MSRGAIKRNIMIYIWSMVGIEWKYRVPNMYVKCTLMCFVVLWFYYPAKQNKTKTQVKSILDNRTSAAHIMNGTYYEHLHCNTSPGEGERAQVRRGVFPRIPESVTTEANHGRHFMSHRIKWWTSHLIWDSPKCVFNDVYAVMNFASPTLSLLD